MYYLLFLCIQISINWHLCGEHCPWSFFRTDGPKHRWLTLGRHTRLAGCHFSTWIKVLTRCILSTLWLKQTQWECGVSEYLCQCFKFPGGHSKPERTIIQNVQNMTQSGRVSLRLREKVKWWSQVSHARCYVNERSEKQRAYRSKAQAGSDQNEDHGQYGMWGWLLHDHGSIWEWVFCLKMILQGIQNDIYTFPKILDLLLFGMRAQVQVLEVVKTDISRSNSSSRHFYFDRSVEQPTESKFADFESIWVVSYDLC